MTTILEGPIVQQTNVEPSKKEVCQPESCEHEQPTRRLWTRADYHKAGELGFFGPEERMELINGEIWNKVSPQSIPHSSATVLTAEALRSAFGAAFHVREEKPLVLNDLTEPEPDVVVVRGTARAARSHPTPLTAALVVEVSEATLRFDQTMKAEAYARSGVTDYWILKQRAGQLEVRRYPGLLEDNAWGYRLLQIIPDGGQVSPLAAPELIIQVADLLPSLPDTNTDTDAQKVITTAENATNTP